MGQLPPCTYNIEIIGAKSKTWLSEQPEKAMAVLLRLLDILHQIFRFKNTEQRKCYQFLAKYNLFEPEPLSGWLTMALSSRSTQQLAGFARLPLLEASPKAAKHNIPAPYLNNNCIFLRDLFCILLSYISSMCVCHYKTN